MPRQKKSYFFFRNQSIASDRISHKSSAVFFFNTELEIFQIIVSSRFLQVLLGLTPDSPFLKLLTWPDCAFWSRLLDSTYRKYDSRKYFKKHDFRLSTEWPENNREPQFFLFKKMFRFDFSHKWSLTRSEFNRISESTYIGTRMDGIFM